MPKRQRFRRVDTPDLQGENSYVVLGKPTYGEIRELGQITESEEDNFAKAEASLDLLIRYIQEWNWVDDEDKPLPLPRQDESVVERLTLDEVLFLLEEFNAGVQRKKEPTPGPNS